MSYFKIFLLLCCISLFEKGHADAETDNVFAGILKENIPHFTDPTRLSATRHLPFESLIASAMTHHQNSHLPEVIFGNFQKAFVKMTIYSSPTCTHCAEYHHNVMPKLLKLCEENKLVLVLRSFVSNLKWDLVACKISWAKGPKYQFEFMSKILNDQNRWLIPAVYHESDAAERSRYIEQLEQTLQAVAKHLQFNPEELRNQLKIKEDDPCGLLKLYGLAVLGIELPVLIKALNSEEMERDILKMTLGAKDDHGNLLNFTPAIFIQKYPAQNMGQGSLQDRNLDVEAVEKLIIEAQKGF